MQKKHFTHGTSHSDVDWGTIFIDGLWGSVGGLLSFGVADIGGEACKTLAETFALRGSEFWKQLGSDFATTFVITSGTWLNATKMNNLNNFCKIN